MTEMMPVIDPSWVPDACTLPTVERPLRLMEFDDVFRDAVTAVHRIDARRAEMVLRPDPAVAARAADLVVRETQCCSFFAFSLSATGGALTLQISTPAEQVDVLEALVERAMSAAGLVTQ